MSTKDLQKSNQIEQRKTGDPVPELASIDPLLGQYNFGDVNKFVEFAKLMCQAGEMLPKHAQRNPAICLALTMRAVHWGFDPFGLAFESFQAKDGGPVGYQAKVFTAVMRKAGVRLNYRYEGKVEMLDKPVKSYKGNEIAKRTAIGNRKCICWTEEEDGRVLEYETPTLDNVTIKNSPLWHNDPDQQLAYYAGRGWARRHRADLMLGAYSDDEMVEMRQMRDVTPREAGFAQLGRKARQEATGAQSSPEDDRGGPDGAEARTDPDTDDSSTQEDAEDRNEDIERPANSEGSDATEPASQGKDGGAGHPRGDNQDTDARTADPEDAFPGSEEFNAGAKAFKAGKEITDCPAYETVQARSDWLGGWVGASKAAQAGDEEEG